MFGWLFGKKSDNPYPGHVPPRPIPHSEKALLEQWHLFPESVQDAYGSFARYKEHYKGNPNRGLNNPIPQPWPMHKI